MLKINANGKVSIIKKEAFCFLIKQIPITKDADLMEYFKSWIYILDIHSLYTPEVQRIVKKIKEKAKEKEVNFISSNPDFAIIRVPNVEE